MFTPPLLTLRNTLLVMLGVCGTLLALAYVLFQARFLIMGPMIEMPAAASGRSATRVITLAGTAHNITRLWLNDRPIFTDQNGRFDEALVLQNGYTIATLKAEDRYGRTTRVVREYVFVPATFIQ